MKTTLFLLNSETIHKMKETKPSKREIMMDKITENLYLAGLSMVGWYLFLSRDSRRENREQQALEATQETER